MSTTRKQWSFDLNVRDHDPTTPLPSPPGMKQIHYYEQQVLKEQSIQPSSTSFRTTSTNTSANTNTTTTTTTTKQSTLQKQIMNRKKSKAMDLALSPGKQLFMNGFMMYMSGKNLNMFSISITGMAILNPCKAILNLQKSFAPLEEDDITSGGSGAGAGKSNEHLQMPKFLYVVLNCIWLGFGLYKMGSMRLLPTTSADWSGTVVWKELLEMSSVPPA